MVATSLTLLIGLSCVALSTNSALDEHSGEAQAQHGTGPEVRAPLGTRAVTKIRYYLDDDQLTVMTPIITVKQRLFDSSQISIEYDEDIISAATVDVRTAASAHFKEIRKGASVAWDQRIVPWDADLSASLALSLEYDYASATLALGGSKALLDKNLTLGGGYAYVHNLVGRSQSPFEHLVDTLQIHALNASATQLLSQDTFVQISGSAIAAYGLQSSVYRYVPVYLESLAPTQVSEQDLLTQSPASLYRLAETLPRERYRGALVARINHHFDWDMFVSADYRFYLDTWLVSSHTAGFKVYQHLPWGLVLRLRNRTYFQTAARFYQTVYTAAVPGERPELISMDRELATFWYDLAGIKLSWRIDSLPLIQALIVDVKVDLQYTRYLDFFYLPSRTAFIIQGGTAIEL